MTGSRCGICNAAAIRVKKYGITWEVALAIPAECELCGTPGGESPLELDHCHETEAFRGWLCKNCNVMLGHAEDSIEILELAIQYLRKRGEPR